MLKTTKFFIGLLAFGLAAQLRAQTLLSPTAVSLAASDSIVQIVAEELALPAVQAADLPGRGGSFCFWLVVPNARGGMMAAPMPCLPPGNNLPIFQMSEGQYLLDGSIAFGGTSSGGTSFGGTSSTSPQFNSNSQLNTTLSLRNGMPAQGLSLEAALGLQADAVAAFIGQIQSAPAASVLAVPNVTVQTRMVSLSLTDSHPAYLTNLTARVAGDGSVTVNLTVAGGTNFVPYDLLATTNLAMPFSTWSWLGIAYPANLYTYAKQPNARAFYALATPTKTMTVGLGDDSVGQCDVPPGLTNAVQAASGSGRSLVLKPDGTVVAWGTNNFGQGVVPTNLTGVAMIAAGYYHNVALLTNGAVVAWGQDDEVTNLPAGLTNAVAIAAQAYHTLALRRNGTVVAWGESLSAGETSVPVGLTNITALAAGALHNLVVSNGYVMAWGDNRYGQCNVPAGLSNVWDVAAGIYHSLALRRDGTVVAWGTNDYGQCNVPAGLTNVVAIAAGGSSSLALKNDGTVAAWGASTMAVPAWSSMTHVIGLAASGDHALALRTGPPTFLITQQPVDMYQVPGGTITFTARGAGLYGVTYQWQTNGVNLPGATNATLTVTNVQAPALLPAYRVIVTDNGGLGSLTSSNAWLHFVTPPVITYQSQPTNLTCLYGNYLSFAVTATAPGMTNGFPLTYQWQWNGTNIPGATGTNYAFTVTDANSGLCTVVVRNAAGSATASWRVTLNNNLNVTNDLLLIYNVNSADSTALKDYYLAHRPMVSGANVLGVACITNEIFTSLADYTNQLARPLLNWLASNPAKRPQYVILFYDMPTRLLGYPSDWGSVSYNLRTLLPDWQPFVNFINAGNLADCKAYVDKIATIGNQYAPGKLVISASAGGYGNTNYVVDDVTGNYCGDTRVSNATNGLLAAGVPASAIFYLQGCEIYGSSPHITRATNVAGYICWGAQSALGLGYATNGVVKWTGNSGWWIMETIESYNGQRVPSAAQGNFIKWFSPNAFGGTNYSNTPVGAVCYVEEPYIFYVNNSSVYFGLWAGGKNFAICAWMSRLTPSFQAVGDPFITR